MSEKPARFVPHGDSIKTARPSSKKVSFTSPDDGLIDAAYEVREKQALKNKGKEKAAYVEDAEDDEDEDTIYVRKTRSQSPEKGFRSTPNPRNSPSKSTGSARRTMTPSRAKVDFVFEKRDLTTGSSRRSKVPSPAKLDFTFDDEPGDLTPSQRRQRHVQKTALQLKSLTPEKGKPAVWDSHSAEKATHNLNTLLQAARDPAKSRTPSLRKSSIGSPSKKGKKRARPEDGDDEYTPHRAIKRPAIRSATSLPLKTAGSTLSETPSIPKVQHKVDLAKLAPHPLRISYRPHRLEDRSDSWYTEMFRRLFRKADQFVSHYFGVHDLSQREGSDPWAESMAPEFVAWAELVAGPDDTLGGWDALLRDTAQRRWLVMGVLMKILRVKVWEVDLFGCGEEQGKLLHQQSRTFMGDDRHEGFQRTAIKADAVRTMLGKRSVTDHFYPCVAALTAQISLLLKPLTDYLHAIPPRKGKSMPEFRDQYQALHNLVSTAAYLSICMRLSHTIFQFNDMSPGAAWSDKDMHSLEDQLYVDSREAVNLDFEDTRAQWEERRQELETQLQGLDDAGERETRAGKIAFARLGRHREIEPKMHDWEYKAMVKIGVWPSITRYKPGGDEDDAKGDSGKYLRDKDGMRILEVSKAAVVVYYGRDGEKRKRLREWLREKWEARTKGIDRLRGNGRVLAGTVAAVAGVMVLGGFGMLSESFPGMDCIEAGRFLACEILGVSAAC